MHSGVQLINVGQRNIDKRKRVENGESEGEASPLSWSSGSRPGGCSRSPSKSRPGQFLLSPCLEVS